MTESICLVQKAGWMQQPQDNRVRVSFWDRQRCFQGCICLYESPTFVCRANLLTQSVSLRNDIFIIFI